MAITTPFSSQNTTIEIFNDATATTALVTAIKNALALSTTALKQDALATAYTNFFAATSKSAIATITATAAAFTNGATVTGTWTYATGAAGTFTATASSTTVLVATLTVTTTAQLPAAATYTTGFGFAFNATGVTSIPLAEAATASTVVSAATIIPKFIGKVTAAGDTGKTYAGVSAKLLNESGTMKAKGSSDEGDFTIDFLNAPGDEGQIAMADAFNDESGNANRVFRLVHGSSGADTATSEKVYFVGMVTELKKTRGAIDNFVQVKSKISIQNGLYEYNP